MDGCTSRGFSVESKSRTGNVDVVHSLLGALGSSS